MKLLSRVQPSATPWTAAYQAPPSVRFSRQEWGAIAFSEFSLEIPGDNVPQGIMRLLRVPGTARRANQLILKETNPEYSLEGLMLKLQYFGHLM